MRELIRFELKKIVCKKSFVFAFTVLFGLQVFLAVLGAFGNVYVTTQRAEGAGSEDTVLLESFLERNRIDRAAGQRFTGTVFDGAFLKEVEEAFAPYMEAEDESHRLTDEYRQNARKYEVVLERLKMYTGLRRSGYRAAQQSGEEDFYEGLEERRRQIWEQFLLSEGESRYWEERRGEQPQKLTYEYCYAYEEMVGMQGAYMTHMLLVFFFGMTMTFVFLAEVNLNTDQIILCTKKGRAQLYFAKLAAGGIVTLGVALVFSAALFAGRIAVFGPEGFGARLSDAVAPWYPSGLSVGGAFLLFVAVLLLSSLLISLFAMLLSWVTRNGIVSIAILVGGLFAARLIPIPPRFPLLGKLWHALPINLLKLDEGFLDMRLFHIFGGYLTVWQMALILYAALIALLVLAGKRLYCRAEVSGR